MRMPGVEREREHGLLHTYEVCFHSIEKNEHAWEKPDSHDYYHAATFEETRL